MKHIVLTRGDPKRGQLCGDRGIVIIVGEEKRVICVTDREMATISITGSRGLTPGA